MDRAASKPGLNVVIQAFKLLNPSPLISRFWSKKQPFRSPNSLFTLHSKITAVIVLTAAFLLGYKDYFGEYIRCMPNSHIHATFYMEKFCWLHGLFFVKEEDHSPNPKRHFATTRTIKHKYYQWVYLVLLLQAFVFRIPESLWKSRTGRLASTIRQILEKPLNEQTEQEERILVSEAADHILLGKQYLSTHLFCEILCLIHVILEFVLLNVFLGGNFYRLGLLWYKDAGVQDGNIIDPMFEVFPRLVMCKYHEYGLTGELVNIDAQCFLPLNIVNEKLFVVLWFWLIFLGAVSFLMTCESLLEVTSSFYRYKKLKRSAPGANKFLLRRLSSLPGNYFVLLVFARNMLPSHFSHLLLNVENKFNNKTGKPLELKMLQRCVRIGQNPNSKRFKIGKDNERKDSFLNNHGRFESGEEIQYQLHPSTKKPRGKPGFMNSPSKGGFGFESIRPEDTSQATIFT